MNSCLPADEGVKIRVLGCSGAIAQGCQTTSFLLDNRVLIDAGTGVADLPLEALIQVDHILISHSHLDHILAVPLLADTVIRNRMARGAQPIVLHALPETIEALHTHIFNGVIWPDFTRLPSKMAPVLQMQAFEVGDTLSLAGRQIEILSASHTVPAVGFAVHTERGAWVYTGDTGPNPALWKRLAQFQVAQLVIEVAFANEAQNLARISRHLCPSELEQELKQLKGSIEVFITHIKPGEEAAVMTELAQIQTPHRIQALVAGQEMRWG